MKFLLPSEIPQFDFQFELLRANEYFKWKNGKGFDIAYRDADESYCPVGSIEFCKAHGIACSPRNIPAELHDYAPSDIFCCRSQMSSKKTYFAKSILNIKDERNGECTIDSLPFADYEFQATEFIEDGFIGEWRCFVMDRKLLDIKQYVAKDDEALFTLPNRDTVMQMIADFKHAPCAYTLDVGLLRTGRTCIIEVHDFFACGLYKFDDQRMLPAMLWNWYRDYRNGKLR